MIKSNQNAWLKPYIDINTNLRKKTKNGFEKDFFNLRKNVVFQKKYEKLNLSQQKEED